MEKIKVMSIFGTRPEAIKMIPVVQEMQNNKHIEHITVVTAQHREMLDQVLQIFSIVPDYDLNIMSKKQSLMDITTKSLNLLDEVIKIENPNCILVHGDTTTTMAGSLAAYYNRIPLGHVEAGLRTWDKYSPYPEEINRQIAGNIAEMHFAPTEQARLNLLKENKSDSKIIITGNTALDGMNITINKDFEHPLLSQLENKKFILLTAHRRENLGEPMKNIFKAIKRITREFEDIHVVFPIHMNPLVREIADEILKDEEKIHIIEPLDVVGFHHFIKSAHLVMTDSGGIQEEAPFLNTPVLVLRNTTERPEGIDAGVSQLVGTDEDFIYSTTKNLLSNEEAYKKMQESPNPYGDGLASQRITDYILNYFGVSQQEVQPFIFKR